MSDVLFGRIKELEDQLVQAEDISKEMLDLNIELKNSITILEKELVTSDSIAKELMASFKVYNDMSFLQRLWWAFTKKV